MDTGTPASMAVSAGRTELDRDELVQTKFVPMKSNARHKQLQTQSMQNARNTMRPGSHWAPKPSKDNIVDDINNLLPDDLKLKNPERITRYDLATLLYALEQTKKRRE